LLQRRCSVPPARRSSAHCCRVALLLVTQALLAALGLAVDTGTANVMVSNAFSDALLRIQS